MANLGDESKKIQKLVNELKSLGKEIKVNINPASIKEANDTIELLENNLNSIKKVSDDIDSSFASLADRMRDAISINSKNNEFLKQQESIYKQLIKSADKLTDYENEYTELSSKQLIQEKQKVEANYKKSEQIKDQVKEAINQLKIERDALEIDSKQYQLLDAKIKKQQNISDELSAAAQTQEDFVNSLDKQIAKTQKLEGQMGAIGGILKGISKIPILGDVVDADQIKAKTQKVFEEGGSAMKAFTVGAKEFGSQIIGSLSKLNLIAIAVGVVVDLMKMLDGTSGEYAKNMGVSYDEALKLQNSMNDIANSSNSLAVNSKGLMESQSAIAKSLGTRAVLNREDLKTMTELREMSGFNNDELVMAQKLTLATGGNLKENMKNAKGAIADQAMKNGLVINEQQILKDIQSSSAATKLSMQGSMEALGRAAVNAKSLGISMQQLESIAGSMLELESSLESEMQAELLTGRELNLEGARQAALMNDQATLAAELSKNIGTAAEFGNMNRIQQEAIAKSMGMSREEMANALLESEALNKIGKQLSDREKAAFETAKEKYGIEKATQMIKDGQWETMQNQMSQQEKFNKLIEKLQMTLMPIASALLEVLDPIFDVVIFLMPVVETLGRAISIVVKSLLTPFREIGNIIGYITKGEWQEALKSLGRMVIHPVQMLIDMVLNSVNGIIQMVKSIPGLSSLMPKDEIKFDIASKVGLQKADDAMISPTGGLMVSGPEGSIQLNKKDSVIAGTNLGGGGSDNSAIVQELRMLRQDITKLQFVVEMDGNKVGKSIAQNSIKQG